MIEIIKEVNKLLFGKKSLKIKLKSEYDELLITLKIYL
jgi:hypothetical protein